MPDESTPATYAQGWRTDTGNSARWARRIGQPIGPADTATLPGLVVSIDAIDGTRAHGQTGRWRLSGRIRFAGPPGVSRVQPSVLAIAVEGVVRAFTNAVWVSPVLAQWSAVIDATEGSPRIETVSVLVAADEGLEMIPLREAEGGAALSLHLRKDLHGFIDEVKRSSGTVHFIGWARDAGTQAPASRVVLRLDGRPVRSVHPWLARPDVCARSAIRPNGLASRSNCHLRSIASNRDRSPCSPRTSVATPPQSSGVLRPKPPSILSPRRFVEVDGARPGVKNCGSSFSV